jgi:hypothetical protein
MLVNLVTARARRRRGIRTSIISLGLVELVLLLLFPFPAQSYAQGASHAQQKESLGSLSSIGEVYVNDSPAPVESTIFAGDRLRTGETGTATFTMSGKGTLKITPQSQVLFAGSYLFTAELEAGTVVLSSISGPNGVTLRIGNFVIVSSIRQQSATSKTDRTMDGSFRVSCLDGSVGVLTLDGKAGQFLQAGQSLSISAKNEMSPFSSAAARQPAQALHSGWLYLGLGGAAAAAAAATLGHGGGRQSVSPSTP